MALEDQLSMLRKQYEVCIKFSGTCAWSRKEARLLRNELPSLNSRIAVARAKCLEETVGLGVTESGAADLETADLAVTESGAAGMETDAVDMETDDLDMVVSIL